MSEGINNHMRRQPPIVTFGLRSASYFWRPAVCAVLLSAFLPPVSAQFIVSLQPETLGQYDHYLKTAVTPVDDQRIAGRRSFLWIDENPKIRERARKGEVVTTAITGKDGRSIPGGLVHDWVGAVFLPGVPLDRVRDFLQDQALHEKVYPEITSARTVSRADSTSITQVRMTKKKLLTVVLDVEYENSWESPGSDRWVLRSHTRKVAEVEEAGTPAEHAYPEDEGHGFLWRMNSLWRLRERDGGVWVELRVVSLSRDTPSSLGWIIRPIIRDFPSDSIESTLTGMRKALRG